MAGNVPDGAPGIPGLENVPDAKPGIPGQKSKLHKKVAHKIPKVYNMKHKQRGYAVIINNKKFTDLPERRGTDIDRNEMKSLLMSMGFPENHIIIKNNCSAAVMEDTMREVASYYTDQNFDCFVCVVLSHGSPDGNIVGEGSEDTISVGEFSKPFRGSECPALNHKPKIFYFQMCRGEKTDEGVPETDHDAEEDECVELQVPSEADFLLAFSVVPGYLSWRNELNGSWFIQSVVDVFRSNEQWRTEDLVSMQTEVNQTVALDFGNQDLKQMPCFNSTLTRKVIFSDTH